MTTFEKILEGLTIFNGYAGASMQPEHDEIHAGADVPVSDEHAARLAALGWTKQEPTWWRRFT